MKHYLKISVLLICALGMLNQCAAPADSGDGVPGTPPTGPGTDPKTPPGGDPTKPGQTKNRRRGTRLDDWHIGNGGDLLRKHIIDSKKMTRTILDKVRPGALVAKNDKLEKVKPFVLKYYKHIANDINISDFRYFDKKVDKHEQVTCAYSWPKQGAPIVLKYELCKATLRTPLNTAWLILHEIAHHFQLLPDVAPIVASMPGATDYQKEEEFADSVAELILDAWTNGRFDWEQITTIGAPAARTQHSAVWTDGSLFGQPKGAQFANSMIVWGGMTTINAGSDKGEVTNTGGAYSMDTGKWLPISHAGAPTGRVGHAAVWTGSKMIVWGGRDGDNRMDLTGGVWDAETDTWELISYPYEATLGGVPAQGQLVQTVTMISETEVLIFGNLAHEKGGDEANANIVGAIYNFAEKDPAKRWTPVLKSAGALVKTGGHTATFVGKGKVFIFGGTDESRKKTNTATLFNIKTRGFEVVEVDKDIAPRKGHTAVYTAKGVIIFGRDKSSSGRKFLHGSGAIYDVHSTKADKWTLLSSQSTPERTFHTAVWSGLEMLIFGGEAAQGGRGTLFSSVSKFDPSNMGWSSVASNYHGPDLVQGHTAVWTGYAMLIWGGETQDGGERPKHWPLNKGYLFYP